MSECRHCRAPIKWVRLDSGKTMPVNALVDREGSVAASWQGPSLIGYPLSKVRPLKPGFDRYRPHRADCDPDKPRGPRPSSLL